MALEASFSETEVWEVIKNLAPGKVPGPNGFRSLFYQRCWDFIKTDVIAAFHCLGRLVGNSFDLLNQELLTLLPKKPDAQEARDYCPIS